MPIYIYFDERESTLICKTFFSIFYNAKGDVFCFLSATTNAT